jgi:uncharacterized caspase-like protein
MSRAWVLFLFIFLSVLSTILAPTCAEAKRVALIIANSNYKKADFLPNPVNDAKAITKLLMAIGFEKDSVTVRTDLTYDAMRLALRDFSREATGADVALIYFAGHGLGSGVNFLIPIDAELRAMKELPREAFSQRDLEATVQSARGLKMVILDACRNDPGRGLCDRGIQQHCCRPR